MIWTDIFWRREMEGFHVSGCVHMIKRAGGKGNGTFPL
jgi:hypothetical protein